MTPYRHRDFDDEHDGRPELIKKRARSEAVVRLMIFVTFLVVLAALAVLVFNATQSLYTRHQLLSCTTPGEKCFDEGQARTAVLVKQLIDANQAGDAETQLTVLLANICMDEPRIRNEVDIDRRFELLSSCVEERKAELK